MDIVIVVFGVLYLCGFNIGVPLAICSIIEGILVCILNILKAIEKSKEEEKIKDETVYWTLKINKD